MGRVSITEVNRSKEPTVKRRGAPLFSDVAIFRAMSDEQLDEHIKLLELSLIQEAIDSPVGPYYERVRELLEIAYSEKERERGAIFSD